MRFDGIVDPEVEVDLLRSAVGPVGGYVVGRQLHADARTTIDEHHVPVVLGIDGAAQHPGPEAALGSEIGGIEHDDLKCDLHGDILPASAAKCADRRKIGRHDGQVRALAGEIRGDARRVLPTQLATALLDAVRHPEDLEETTRSLLEFLQRATGVDSTYLTLIHWDDSTQEVLVAHNAGELDIAEGLLVEWCDTLCRRALLGGPSATDDVPGVYGDSDAARELGLVCYISVPVTFADRSIFGTLCGASAHRTELGDEATDLFRFAASIIAAHLQRDRQQEAERARALQAEERFRAQSLALATLEHEMKTPLTVLAGWAETLDQAAGVDPDQQAIATRAMGRQVLRLRRMVDELLLMAREGHAPQLDRRAVDLRPLLDDVARSYERAHPDRRWSVTVTPGLHASVDPAAVEQAVAHLLDNAVKYSAYGDAVELTASRDGDEIVIAVSDSGIGVPEDPEPLFEPFARFGDERIDSVGLGLYIVRNIVTGHGGTISAARRPDGGSRFTVRLPAL